MTYAAFYIQPEKTLQKMPNPKAVQGIKGQISNAWNNAVNTVQNFDISQMAKNINLQNATAFTQKYGVAALTMVINQRPVTNQMMLDSLFNGIAPALGITAGQMGFNSVMQMKAAVQAGNINVASFMNGLSGALDVVTGGATGLIDYSKYGEEIPIDLTTSFSENHTMETPDRKVQSGQTYNEYYHILPLTLPFSGVIKDNKNFTAHEFADRLTEVADSLKPFTFRAGNKVYENYVFVNFQPARETENGIKFDAEIKYIQSGDVEFVKVDIPRKTSGQGSRGGGGKSTKTVKNTVKGQNTANKTSKPNYAGAVGTWNWLTGGSGVSSLPYYDKLLENLGNL